MTQEYIKKTRRAVNFLTQVFSEDTAVVASILSNQANGETQEIIDTLKVVKSFIDDLINDLK